MFKNIVLSALLLPAILSAQPTTTPGPTPSPTPDCTSPASLCGPQPITPTVDCVMVNTFKANTCTAFFGYNSNNNLPITIPAGTGCSTPPGSTQEANCFDPDPDLRNQPSDFFPGGHVAKFREHFDCTNNGTLVWQINHVGVPMYATASAASVQCAPLSVSTSCVDINYNPDNTIGTLTAHFTYTNNNSFDIFIPVGPANTFSGALADRGQPTTFVQGGGTFSITFDPAVESFLTWTLTVVSTTADSNTVQCVDCNAIPFGTAKLDLCGVCGGTNACVDCQGVVNGSTQVDLCGVCGGTNACLGCDNVPNSGAKLDSCGVCNGTNACIGCDGIINSGIQTDRCGVCGGNGSSCLGCTGTDITAQLFALDGGSHAQKHILDRAVTRLLKASNSRSTRKYAKKILAQSDALHLENWNLAWSLPQVVQSCSNTSFCVQSSNTSTITQYNANSATFKSLVSDVIKRKRKELGYSTSGDDQLLRLAAKYDSNNNVVSSSVPVSTSSCF